MVLLRGANGRTTGPRIAMTSRSGRLLLLVPTETYRIGDFLAAARHTDIPVTVGSNRRQALEKFSQGGTVTIDFQNIAKGVAQITDYNAEHPLAGIIAVDDITGVLAATACRELGLPGNAPEAVGRTGNKHLLRECLSAAALPQPSFTCFAADTDPTAIASTIAYPCVLKPLNLSASRGVIRANTSAEFIQAFVRVREILALPSADGRRNPEQQILVEDYWPGDEVALEGLLTNGRLNVLALFDKPDPLEGPYFKETIYVTPSRHPLATQEAIIGMTERALAALGLSEGSIHAELRVNQDGPWLIEVAARSIGGLCARILDFGTGIKLEALILQHARGGIIADMHREDRAAGVMMIPVPYAGTFLGAAGEIEARVLANIEEITFTVPPGQPVLPLPDAANYLGFIFAKGDSPEEVEAALRTAHTRLEIRIDGAE